MKITSQLKLKTIIRLLMILPLFYFSSCTEDNSSTPTIDDRDKFVGKWSCKETISGAFQIFEIKISKIGAEDSINIENFSNYGTTADAIGLISGNSLTIPSQNIGVSSVPVGGTGIYSGNGTSEKITMNYSSDGSSATAICTK